MSYLTELIAERDEKLAEYRVAKSGPSHSVDGRSFDHDGHRAALLVEIRELNQLIIRARGPVEVHTIALG